MEPILHDDSARGARGQFLGLVALITASIFAPGLHHAVAQDSVTSAPAASTSQSPRSLPAQRRVLRHFDFEEAAARPMLFPDNFYRYGGRGDQSAASQGFTLSGVMAPTNEFAYSGDWSFGFDLDGASLAARVPTTVLPIMPMNNYEVTAQVRTHGLIHARARVVAWLVDATGEMIAGSMRASPPVRTSGRWRKVTVAVDGVFQDATDLILELQLVQPRQYRGGQLSPTEPAPADMNGAAWFDDVQVRHVPRIDISTGTMGNVLVDPTDPKLHITIHDLVGGRLITHLRVYDLNDRLVLTRDFDSTRMRGERIVDIGGLRHGWYHAVIDLDDEHSITGSAAANFLIMPSPLPRTPDQLRRFGVQLQSTAPADLKLLEHLGVGTTVIAISGKATTIGLDPTESLVLRDGIDALLDDEMEIVFALDVTLDQLIQRLDRDDAGTVLDEMLLRFGQHVHRWQLGTAFASLPFESGQFQESVDGASASLSRYVAELQVITPWRAEYELDKSALGRGYNIVLPYEMTAAALLELAPNWDIAGDQLLCSLKPLPKPEYRPRQRVVDLMHRALHGWRAGLPQLIIDAPWSHDADGALKPEPEPAFGAWHILSEQLADRHFAGELDLGPDIHVWLIEGTEAQDDAMVAWCDISGSSQLPSINLFLGRDPVEVIDAFGNRHTVQLENEHHSIPLQDMPIFIKGINLKLAQFRAGFSIDPGFIQTEHRQLDHSIVLRNPWDVPLSGTVRLFSNDDWNLKPRISTFNIRPGGEFSVPLSIVPNRSITAGQKTVRAEFELVARELYEFTAETHVEAGLRQIHLAEQWRYGRNERAGTDDLIIQLQITNTSNRVLNLSAFMYAPEMTVRRRAIGLLEPGEEVTRSFQVASGIEQLSGQTVFVGVDEVDDVSRLIHEMTLPRFNGVTVAGVDTADQK